MKFNKDSYRPKKLIQDVQDVREIIRKPQRKASAPKPPAEAAGAGESQKKEPAEQVSAEVSEFKPSRRQRTTLASQAAASAAEGKSKRLLGAAQHLLRTKPLVLGLALVMVGTAAGAIHMTKDPQPQGNQDQGHTLSEQNINDTKGGEQQNSAPDLESQETESAPSQSQAGSDTTGGIYQDPLESEQEAASIPEASSVPSGSQDAVQPKPVPAPATLAPQKPAEEPAAPTPAPEPEQPPSDTTDGTAPGTEEPPTSLRESYNITPRLFLDTRLLLPDSHDSYGLNGEEALQEPGTLP